jgi:tRNA(Ile)-lysidine synthase
VAAITLASFEEHFHAHFPEVVGHSLVVALSAGPDSVALLCLLSASSLGLTIEAAYVDHRSRPCEVAGEIELCATLCHRLGVRFHCLRLDPSEDQRWGREGTWRHQRYRALTTLAKDRGIPHIATGHHADDIAEGVLVQLLRGAGPRAMAGIAASTQDGVIRPLLPWRRSEIRAWLEHAGVSWCEDSSNRSVDHLRNRVRLEVLPCLSSASPQIASHLVHLAAALSADEAAFADQLTTLACRIDPWTPDGGVSIHTLSSMSQALRCRWLQAQAARVGVDRVSRRQLELFEQLVTTGSPRAMSLQRRWRLRIAGGQLWLEPPTPQAAFSFVVDSPGTYPLPLPGWELAVRSGACDGSLWQWAASPGMTLLVRSCRPGDRVGTNGSGPTVRSLLTPALPRHLRNAWPLISVGDTICWIPGVWQDSTAGSEASVRAEVRRRCPS